VSVRSVIKHLVPASLRLRRNVASAWSTGEPELRYVPVLCDRDRVAIDVGANRGIYSFVMQRHAKSVIALEPDPDLTSFLRRALRGIKVIEAAASEHEGTATLRIPLSNTGTASATIEASNTLDEIPTRQRDVRLVALDSLDLEPVGFIKIDVEGHELSTLRGAARVLTRDKPNLLVEAEERHRHGAVASLVELLGGHGYEGLFLLDGTLLPIQQFDPSLHQVWPGADGRRPYVNNFFFVRPQNVRALCSFLICPPSAFAARRRASQRDGHRQGLGSSTRPNVLSGDRD
jgi:FkbM family methyltransferase